MTSYPQNRNTFQIVIIIVTYIVACWAAEIHASLALFSVSPSFFGYKCERLNLIPIFDFHYRQIHPDIIAYNGYFVPSSFSGSRFSKVDILCSIEFVRVRLVSILLQNSIIWTRLIAAECRALGYSSRAPGCTNRWLDFWFWWSRSEMSGIQLYRYLQSPLKSLM